MLNWYFIEKKLLRCSLTESEIDQITDRLFLLENQDNEFAQDEIQKILYKIEMNQHDPITMGMYYSQTDILNHLKKLK